MIQRNAMKSKAIYVLKIIVVFLFFLIIPIMVNADKRTIEEIIEENKEDIYDPPMELDFSTASGCFDEDFNTYNLGDLQGQGSWTGNTNFNVEDSVFITTNGVEALDVAGQWYTIYRDFTGLDELNQYFWLRTTTTNDTHMSIQFWADSATNYISSINVSADDDIIQLEATISETLLDGVLANTWYLVNTQIDNSTNQVRARVGTDADNFGAWSNWLNPIAEWTSIDRVKLGKDDDTGDGYIDDFYCPEVEEEPVEEISSFSLASVSVEDMNGINLVYIIWMLGDIFIFLASFYIVIKT